MVLGARKHQPEKIRDKNSKNKNEKQEESSVKTYWGTVLELIWT